MQLSVKNGLYEALQTNSEKQLELSSVSWTMILVQTYSF